ncbi:MgtC/SapB family protein [Romboutsia sp. Marseille-P6047]|uniref:MgtC/SapB family protein n=1 Tax=Romboutsia sp. Marseille-P6047 TaxID=2161817 RepID=UPI000F0575C8|nr:MgtC/SapB family protein [Romboutsia sp. Marseille-P6047]
MGEREIFLRLLLALVVGGVTGIERERLNKFAGFRTHILVSLGSCISSIISLELFLQYSGTANLDPARLSAQVLSGIGFLGAGTILKTSSGVKGLTTAAGIWSTACIGIAIGYGYYFLALVSWIFLIIVLYALQYMEMWRKRQKSINIIITMNEGMSIDKLVKLLCDMSKNDINFSMDKNDNTLIFKLKLSDDKSIDHIKLLEEISKINEEISVKYV